MSVRNHVTAIRNVQRGNVRETFEAFLGSGFAEVELHEHGGWISFVTSVWGVRRSDLIKGLVQLNHHALQFTSEDGDRWYLTLFVPGAELETIVHEFSHHQGSMSEDGWHEDDAYEEAVDPRLAFLEDEPSEKESPKTAFDCFSDYYSELGVSLPKQFVQRTDAATFENAIGLFRAWQQERVTGFLESAGATFDEGAVRRVLSWHGLTDDERYADLGNLPRLLSVIGLGGDWDRYVVEVENPPPDVDDEEPQREIPAPSWIGAIEQLMSGIDPCHIEGDPVDLPLGDFSLVAFFPDSCRVDNDIHALVTVSIPPSADSRPIDFSGLGRAETTDIEFRSRHEGFQIGFADHLLLDRRNITKFCGPDAAAVFRTPPDGTLLECAFAADDESATRQIYRGVVKNRNWEISSTYPPLPAMVLRDALTLASQSSNSTHTLRDEAEAAAVLEAAEKDCFLDDVDIRLNGLEISCDYGEEYLAKAVFRRRFCRYWDVTAVDQSNESYYLRQIEMEREMRREAVETARQEMAPRLGEPIYCGTAGNYWNSDLGQFRDLETQPREVFEQGMTLLKFTLMGDITTKRFRDYVLRCFVSSDHRAYACLTASMYGYVAWEFVSDFSDGSRLTTTSSPMVESRPAVQLYYKDFPGLEPGELYQQHLRLFERFREHKQATLVVLDPTLMGLARCLDDSIARTDEDERMLDDEE